MIFHTYHPGVQISLKIPRVTVLLPTYNAHRTLRAAINSIIQQSWDDWELIVIDDGSTDDTVPIALSLRDPRINIIEHNSRKGLPTRLNEGIELARGEYLARMDADDVSYPERLAKQVEWLQNHPEVDLIASGALLFDGNGDALGMFGSAETHGNICSSPAFGFLMCHPTWMGRANWFRRFRYDARFHKAQDFELLFRSCRNSIFHCLPDILLGYRRDTPRLPKLLLSRWFFARALLKNSRHIVPPADIARGVLLQALRAIIDLFIACFRLERLLMKRLPPVSTTERDRWERLWSRIQLVK